MSQILDVLNELAATKSRIKKVEILNSLQGELEEDFKLIVKATYDTAINYYVRSWPKPERYSDVEVLTWPHIIALLSVVSSRQVTGNNAIEFLTRTESDLTIEQAEVFRRIVERDLKCGATASTFNVVWPKLIAEHPYMRCSSFSKKNLSKIKLPCFSQTKADGLYVDIIVEDGVVTYKSRTGETKAFNGAEKDDLFKRFSGHVFMGEALVVNDDGSVMSRKEGNGYLNSDDIDANKIRFALWDIVPLGDYRSNVCKIKYSQRYAGLCNAVNSMNHANVKLVESKRVNSVTEIVEHFKEEVEQGEEGTVVKNLDAFWKDGTSSDQVKIKIAFDCELKVVGYEEGTGKYTGKLGALKCESEDGKVIVSVGGGFSDKQREEFFTDDIIGSIVTVKSNDLVDNRAKPGIWSLFLPRFIEVRTDKTEADTYERIVEQRDSFTDTLSAIK